mmetsp:Transcript_52185/g.113665  ORF Transcript_52185/g.113665 Transcript_52185/m.113665 type:complete len:440 (-) Transcript_52185:852-2171(-)
MPTTSFRLPTRFACLLAVAPVVAPSSAPMSEDFATWKELQNSTGIEGATWAELQMRCAPGAEPGQTQGGWISDGTPILEVLRRDWDSVENMGTTHVELAAHLDAIWALGTPCDYDHPKAYIDYDVRTLPSNTLNTSAPVRLYLSCTHTRGIQTDLLDPNSNGFMTGWNTDWTINDTKIKVHIGGANSERGIVQYIKLFGFYEGGAYNPYRINPSQLVDLLTNAENLPLEEPKYIRGAAAELVAGPQTFIILGILVSIVFVAALFHWMCCEGRSRSKRKSHKERSIPLHSEEKVALVDRASRRSAPVGLVPSRTTAAAAAAAAAAAPAGTIYHGSSTMVDCSTRHLFRRHLPWQFRPRSDGTSDAAAAALPGAFVESGPGGATAARKASNRGGVGTSQDGARSQVDAFVGRACSNDATSVLTCRRADLVAAASCSPWSVH